MMEILGIIFLVIIGLAILLGLYVVGRSVPDIRRYRRVRKM